MRILRFIVEGQIIKPDPTCDFGNLIPRTESFIQAQFSFSKEWNNCLKVAAFYSMIGTEYAPQPIKNDLTCMIPIDAVKRHKFQIQIVGRNLNDGSKFCTNKLTIEQKFTES